MSAAAIIMSLSVILTIIALGLIIYYGITKSKDKKQLIKPKSKSSPPTIEPDIKNIM
jgi:hypothetical protein